MLPFKKRLRTIKRWSAAFLGILLFILGAVTFPLPIPTGLILMAAGLSLMSLNPLLLRWIKRQRSNNPKLDRFLNRLVPHMPAFIRSVFVKTTRPLRKPHPAGKKIADL